MEKEEYLECLKIDLEDAKDTLEKAQEEIKSSYEWAKKWSDKVEQLEKQIKNYE